MYSCSKCISDQTERIWWLIFLCTVSKYILGGFRRAPPDRIRLNKYTGWFSQRADLFIEFSKCLLVGFGGGSHGRIRLNGCAGWSESILAENAYWLFFADRRTVGSDWTDIFADILAVNAYWSEFSRSVALSDQTERICRLIWFYTGRKCLLVVFRRSPHGRIRMNGYICRYTGSKCLLVGIFAERRIVVSDWTDVPTVLSLYRQ